MIPRYLYCFTVVFRDQFVLYEDGYGNHVGRLKEMIIRGGENLFPKEIEYFLESHPSISQVQVIIHTYFCFCFCLCNINLMYTYMFIFNVGRIVIYMLIIRAMC